MIKNLSLLGFAVVSALSAIAVPKRGIAEHRAIPMSLTLMALRLPNDNRVEALRAQGQPGMQNLKRIAEDAKQTLNVRWKAITAVGQLDARAHQPFLEKFLSAREWYLRSAGLHAVKYGPREVTLKWCRQLLDDPALVVRSTAVQVIGFIKGSELKDVLWERLYAAENYHRGRSLWIRKSIVEELSKFAQPRDSVRFLRLLNHEDQALHPIVVSALGRLTGISRDQRKYPSLDDQKQAWSEWISERQTL